MKLTDFLQDVGRPVAYYPSLRKITGSTNATILLCQFIYWRGKESDPNGWLYKTAEDIEQETGLSYGEQKTARRDLIAAGLLEEHYARLDHQMRFRLLLEAINEKWGTSETSIPESGKPQFGNDAKPLSLNESEITAENTTENTTDIGVPPSNLSEMPIDWQMAANAETIVIPDQFAAKVKDAANLLDMGCKGGGALAEAFMIARRLLIPDSKIKGNRKAARDMLEMGVRPEHVAQAVESLSQSGMTITDLFSISKTAIDLANKAAAAPKSKSFGL